MNKDGSVDEASAAHNTYLGTRVLSNVQLPGHIVDHHTMQQGVHIGEIDMYCRHGSLS